MSVRRPLLVYSALLLALTPAVLVTEGCSKKPSRRKGEIPIKVWVILGTGGNEVFGSDTNKGCRFTRADIEAYLAELQANATTLFGVSPFKPVMAGGQVEINMVHSSEVGFLDNPICHRCAPFDATMADVMVTQEKWEQNHLNLYFAGWLQENFPNQTEYDAGKTGDPRDGGTNVPAFVMINDLWDSELIDDTPAKLAWKVLEHEVGHFLLNRRNTPGYDSNEHVPNSMNHLMRVSPVLPNSVGYPLVLPSSERAETKDRIISGSWTGAQLLEELLND